MSEPVSVRLSATFAWLIDAAAEAPGADRFLAELGARLCGEGLPVAAGALTLDVSHPLIARRGWLWRADTGAIIEALGFAGLAQGTPDGDVERRWLAGFGSVHEDGGPKRPWLGWAGSRAFSAA